MKICFMKSRQACDRYRPECRQIVANLEQCEVTVFPNKADVIVQFFCIETDECIQEAALQLHYIGKLKKPNAKVIIAGCAANVLGDDFLQFQEVDYVIQRKPVAKAVLEILGQSKCENRYFLGDDEPFDFSLEISNGCQKKCGPCNFCFNGITKIPVRSKPMEYLLTAVKNATSDGARRVQILALNTCNYGIDFPEHKQLLHELVKEVSEIEEIKIIDIYSLTVSDMYPELIQEIVTNSKIGLVEMGIQCGSDHLLQVMNTGSTIAEIEKILQALLPQKRLKTIVIVGHPEETEEDLAKTIEILEKYNLWHAQVNPFILIEGTKSSQMKQLPKEVVRERFERITRKLSEMKKEYLDSLIGTRVKGYLSDALRQADGTTKIYIEAETSPVIFCYVCSEEEFKQKFEKREMYDLVSCIAQEVISYERKSPIVAVTSIEG